MKFRFFFCYLALIMANVRFFLGDILKCDTLWLTYLLSIVLLLSINYERLKWKYYIVMFCFLLLSIVSANSLLLPLVLLSLLAFSCKDLNVRIVAQIQFWLQLFFFLYMAFAVTSGEIPMRMEDYAKATTIDMGFGNSNSFSLFVFSLLSCLVVGFGGRYNVLIFVVFSVVSVVTYMFAFGRTILFGEIIFLLIYSLQKIKGNFIFYKIKYFISLFPIIFIFLVLFLILNIVNYESLNTMLTGRLLFWFEHLSIFMESNVWIGHDFVSLNDKPLDCSFLALLVTFGIVGYVSYSYFIYMAFNKGFAFLCHYMPLLLSIFVCGFSENILLSYSSMNILFVILLSKAAFNRTLIYSK